MFAECKVTSVKNKKWILKVHNIWRGESFGEGAGCRDFRRLDDGGGGNKA